MEKTKKIQTKLTYDKYSQKELYFSELFKQYYLRLCHYAHTFITDFEVCKDIVQELFVKLWDLDLRNFSPNQLDCFLYRSIKNACLGYFRKQKVKRNNHAHILQRLLEKEEVFIPEVELNELVDKIQEALNKLPHQTRLIFAMHRQQDKTYAAIAKELDISVKGVEFHMSKALQILRLQLKDYLCFIAYFYNLF